MKMYTVKELSGIANISEWSIYELIRRGKISSVKVGRKIIITEASVKEFTNKELIQI